MNCIMMLVTAGLTFMLFTSPPPELLTVAEKSDYTATATSAQVEELIGRIHDRSDNMRLTTLGRTVEGKTIPLAIVANPPVENAEEARLSCKPIVFVLANIHAGEVCGKEASLMLMREFALNPDIPFLNDLIIIFAPNYNADGNDRFGPVDKNRPKQVGPKQVGTRANAQGLDLNRDYIKLEAPEARALVSFLTEWDPHITIDCHTTNGSHHRYVLTYDYPLNPSGHPEPIKFVRDELLPKVTERIKDRTGYDMWFYGNFNKEHTVWETYSPLPRFGGPYQGLRGQMSILSEAYSYAPFKDRVIATREFIREILQYVFENNERVIEIHNLARQETIENGKTPKATDRVGIRHKVAVFTESAIVKGYEFTLDEEEKVILTTTPKDYTVTHNGRFEPTLSVPRPVGYIIPETDSFKPIIYKLAEHGIATHRFSGEAEVEIYTITEITRAEEEFQGHHTVSVEVESHSQDGNFTTRCIFVPTAQPLGNLVVYLLEPQSDDGLVTWNFFDSHLKVGGVFPIFRVLTISDEGL